MEELPQCKKAKTAFKIENKLATQQIPLTFFRYHKASSKKFMHQNSLYNKIDSYKNNLRNQYKRPSFRRNKSLKIDNYDINSSMEAEFVKNELIIEKLRAANVRDGYLGNPPPLKAAFQDKLPKYSLKELY